MLPTQFIYPCHCEKIFDFRGSPLDCFVAFAPRNDMKLVVSLPNPNHLHSHLEKLSPRPLWERVEFQVEPKRNLEIRVRGRWKALISTPPRNP